MVSPVATVACPVAGLAATASPAECQCPGPAPLLGLLEQLRGRPVTLMVGGHKLCGRVLTVNPLVLSSEEGKAIQVDPVHIQSCQF